MQILVASSDSVLCERVRTLCEARGLSVIEASSSGEAIEGALTWGPVGVIVDLTLDSLRGRRAVELIHQCLPSLPLVVIAEEASIDEALELIRRRERGRSARVAA